MDKKDKQKIIRVDKEEDILEVSAGDLAIFIVVAFLLGAIIGSIIL